MTSEFFPGSNQRLPRPSDAPLVQPSAGKTYPIGGKPVTLFSLGELAEELNRRPVTIRKWERDGVIPKATHVKPGKGGDVRGRRRLYTLEQVDGLVRIAFEEGILNDLKKPVRGTRFSARAWALFKELARK